MSLFGQETQLIILRFSADEFPDAEQMEISGDRKSSIRIRHLHRPRLPAENVPFPERRRHGDRFSIDFQFNFLIQRQFDSEEHLFARNRLLPSIQTNLPAEASFLLSLNGFRDPEKVEFPFQGKLLLRVFRIPGIRFHTRLADRMPCGIVAEHGKAIAAVQRERPVTGNLHTFPEIRSRSERQQEQGEQNHFQKSCHFHHLRLQFHFCFQSHFSLYLRLVLVFVPSQRSRKESDAA